MTTRKQSSAGDRTTGKSSEPAGDDESAARPPARKGERKRERRSVERLERPRVLVTGGASSLGRVLCRRLHRSYDVLSLDVRPFPERPKDVEHHEVDLRRKAAQTLVKKKKPELVVHLGPLHDERRSSSGGGAATLETTATLLRLVEQVGAKKLVVLSSAQLYGPSATSSAFLTEEAPLLGGQRDRRLADAISVDMMVQSHFWKQPQMETVILRPVHVVGPHLQNAASRFLRQKRVPVLLGFDPMIQLVHEDDFVDAVARALVPGLRGVFNITGTTQAPLSRILEVRGTQTVPLPSMLFGAALTRVRALRLTRHDANELVHLKYSCLVDGARAARELGFTAKRGLRQLLVDL